MPLTMSHSSLSSSATHSGPRLQWLVRFIASAVVIGLLVATLRGFDFEQLRVALSRVNPWLFVFAALSNFAQLACKAMRWRVLLEDVTDLPFPRLVRYFAAAHAALSLLPARVGDALWVWLLARHGRVPPAAAIASTLIEKLFEGLGLALLVAPLPLLMVLPSTTLWGLEALVIGGVIATIGCVLLARSARVRTFAFRWQKLANVEPALGPLRSSRRFVSCTLWSLGVHLCEAVSIVALFAATGVEAPWAASIFITVTTLAAVLLPSTPAQVGAFELGAMAPLLLLGVPQEPALAFALLFHLLHLAPGVVGLYFAVPFLTERRREAEQAISPG